MQALTAIAREAANPSSNNQLPRGSRAVPAARGAAGRRYRPGAAAWAVSEANAEPIRGLGVGRHGRQFSALPFRQRTEPATSRTGACRQSERISGGRRGGKVRLGTTLPQSRWSLHLPSQHATAARPQSDAGTPPGAGSTITVVRPELHLLAHRFNPPGPAGGFVTCRRR